MATKVKSCWFCTDCGHQQPHWTGQCAGCNHWNTLAEGLKPQPENRRFPERQGSSSRPVKLSEVVLGETKRIPTGLSECDRLLGGGIVPGALTLVGGDPGIGKSTLLLQLAATLAGQGKRVLYVCGEESVEQTSLRAQRLGLSATSLYLLAEIEVARIKAHIDELAPDLLIIDSIQIVYNDNLPSSPGSVVQVREATMQFMHLAKQRSLATFLVGHVTKSGDLAGPRVLEHLVDTVLYFEGDRQHNHRLIRVVKNRFGPTDEIALFQMVEHGLEQVQSPSHLFLEERRIGASGSSVASALEGSRALLVEIQGLVTETCFTTPSRRSTGLDTNRLALLLAVLEKRLGYQLFRCDVFASVVGGMHLSEPGADLGIVAALASSFKNIPIPPHVALFGEVGLSGEVRSVARAESRVKEAIHMGFKTCIVPNKSLKGIPKSLAAKIQLIGVDAVEEAISPLL